MYKTAGISINIVDIHGYIFTKLPIYCILSKNLLISTIVYIYNIKIVSNNPDFIFSITNIEIYLLELLHRMYTIILFNINR